MDAPDPDEAPPVGREPDVEQLKAQVDALQQQLDQQGGQRVSRHRVRKVIAVFLVVVFALSFVASGVGIWLHRNTLNDDVWNERVVPLGEDPDVQRALAAWTTDELMKAVDPQALFQEALPERAQILAVPLTSAVEGFVADKVEQFYASEAFEDIWAAAATRAHDAAIRTLRGDAPAVEADGEKVTINFIPLINAVLAEILKEAPGLVGSDAKLPTITVEDIPAEAREKLGDAVGVDLGDDFGTFTVYDGGKLSTAQEAVRIFDAVVPLTTAIAVLSFVGALAVSTRRRRTLLQLLGVAAVGAILIRRICFILQDEVDSLVKVDVNRPAANAIVATFVDPLTEGAAWALWLIVAVAAIAILTGPYGWVASLRSSIANLFRSATTAVGDRANDDATLQWVARNVDALRIAGYAVGALALWFFDLTWLTFFLIALVVAGWQVLVAQLAGRAANDPAADGDDGQPLAPPPASGSPESMAT
ncbi:hypothetical protein ACE2AJ_13275 [Aquihabitans daechungensis]|uniref:hypothetical protein n=1 Tax=Aquihabitans daechungensis TaxID=1052257 RepID=UPI003BA14BF1